MARGNDAMERRVTTLLLIQGIYSMELLAANLCTGELLWATTMLIVAAACKKMLGTGAVAVAGNEEDN